MRIIVDKHPEQLRFNECLWTRNNIRQLIKDRYGIDIKLSTLGYYLSRWGFSDLKTRQAALYAVQGQHEFGKAD